MRWSTIKPHEWEVLEKRYGEGKPAKPIDERPEISTYGHELWRAFWSIRHSIPSPALGGVNGMMYSEVLAWLNIYRPFFATNDDRKDFVDLLYLLDREYMTLMQDKIKSSDKKSINNGRHSGRNTSKNRASKSKS
jgi:hypothetical protein